MSSRIVLLGERFGEEREEREEREDREDREDGEPTRRDTGARPCVVGVNGTRESELGNSRLLSVSRRVVLPPAREVPAGDGARGDVDTRGTDGLMERILFLPAAERAASNASSSAERASSASLYATSRLAAARRIISLPSSATDMDRATCRAINLLDIALSAAEASASAANAAARKGSACTAAFDAAA